MSNKICKGCGVVLQSSDAAAIGYTPKMEADYCQRCFRIRHYMNCKRSRAGIRRSCTDYLLYLCGTQKYAHMCRRFFLSCRFPV